MRRTFAALAVVLAGCAPTPHDSAPHEAGSPAFPAGVRVNVQTSWYDVEGTEPRAWIASMRGHTAGSSVMPGYFANTVWVTRWSYAGTRRTSTGCEPESPAVEVEVRFTLPRLASDSGVAPGNLAEWRRYSAALQTHENGHAARAFRAAELERDILRAARATSCDALGSQLRAAMQDVIARYQAADREYDAASRHGARQGATLGRAAPDTVYHDVVP